MSFNIIVKSYEHFNRALPHWDTPKGRYIKSKSQYDRACKEAGLIPFEQAQDERPAPKPQYPKETLEFLKTIKAKTDKKGEVKLNDNEINYMIKRGAIKDRDIYWDKLPKHYKEQGGFS